MKSPKPPNGFRPITKRYLRDRTTIPDTNELCGLAAVAMLLHYCGNYEPVETLYARMLAVKAYAKGSGTYLQRTTLLHPKMHYLRYMPLWLLRLTLQRGYVMAASIKGTDGGHIVFVCAADGQNIFYYDPNLDSPQAQRMSLAQWRQRSNKRAAILHSPN